MKRYSVMTVIFLAAFALMTFAVTYPLTLVDDAGNVVTFDKAPARIIDAAPSVTGFMIALGYQNEIVGVTKYDSYSKATDIGLLYPLNLEKIVSLKPDVVFLFGGFQLPQYSKLAKLGIRAFVLNADNLDGIYRDIVDIATIMGNPQKGEKFARDLQNKVNKIALAAYNVPIDQRPTVFYGEPGKQIWTAGSGSFLNEIISLAGGVNVAGTYSGENGWLPVDPAFVVSRNPDIIFVPYYSANGAGAAVKSFESYPGFKDLKAVKDHHVYAIDGNQTSDPDPEIIGVLETIYKDINK